MQKWEYKLIVRSRGWTNPPKQVLAETAKWNIDMEKNLAELGSEGWELVAVTPRSSYLGQPDGVYHTDYAGFTSDELWVFKRPV